MLQTTSAAAVVGAHQSSVVCKFSKPFFFFYHAAKLKINVSFMSDFKQSKYERALRPLSAWPPSSLLRRALGGKKEGGREGGVGGFAPTALITHSAFPKIRALRSNPGQNKQPSQWGKNAGWCQHERHDDQSEALAFRPGSCWMMMRFAACRWGQRCLQVNSNLVQVSTDVQSFFNLCFLLEILTFIFLAKNKTKKI